METVRQLVDATYRMWLEPPDYQPPVCFLGEDIAATDTEFTVGNFALAEDEQLLRSGVLLEVGTELIRVVAYDPVERVVTVRRGELGTVSDPHPEFSPTKISPPYPRLDVFRSVSHNIGTLSPPLFTVRNQRLMETGPGVAPLDDPLAASIIEITRDSRDQVPVGSFDLVDHHPDTGTRSVLVPIGTGDFWVRYRRRVAAPLTEDDTLTALGMEDLWAPAVIAGAAGEVMMGTDLPRTSTEWVTQVLEASNIAIGKRQEVGFSLIQYREMLIERYRREMTQEYRSISSVRVSPFFTSDGSLL